MGMEIIRRVDMQNADIVRVSGGGGGGGFKRPVWVFGGFKRNG